MPDVILPLSHLMACIYLTLPSSACEPLILIVIIILCQNKTSQAWDWENMWMRASLSLSASSWSENREECFSLRTFLSSQLLEGEFSFIKAIHTDINLHCKTFGIGLSLHIYKNRTATNHCLCVYILATFNIFHGYTPAQTSFKTLV